MEEKTKKGIGKLKTSLVISIVVIVVLAGLNIWFYMNKQSLDSEYDALQSTYSSYVATHSHTDTEYDTLNTEYQNYIATHTHTDSEYDTLQSTYNDYVDDHSHADSEYDELLAIANLQKSQLIIDEETIPQSAGTRTLVETFTATYAGYVTISLTSSTTNAYVEIEFYFKGQFFKFTKTLGTSGSTIFCVLPATVSIYVGNSNLINPATHTVSATYWY